MMKTMTIDEDLARMVDSLRDRLERAYTLTTSSTLDDETVAFLVDHGADEGIDTFEAVNEAALAVLDDCLEIVGVWRGQTRDTAELATVEVLFKSGTTTIRLDTASREIRGHWGSSTAWASVSEDVCGYYENLLSP
jgi:hypothetical protein